MNSYFDSNNKKDCNGCGICALKCPKSAIIMKEDNEGFIYPKIDKSKCINCGLCKKICSNNPSNNTFDIKYYAAKNKNDNQRSNSTSGGMFKILVDYVIKHDGYVAGVRFDNNLKAIHDISNDLEIINQFSYSKYVRSDLNNVFVKIEQLLKENKMVLFSGTPCQNYALRKYLIKDYDNLILCEIMCHSNPSPKVFEKFIKNIENKENGKVSYFSFRNKKYNKPYAIVNNREVIYEQYNTAFNSMLISRPSCSNCHFCDSNRKADFTIGDFWGIDNLDNSFNDNKGVSLLIISSTKAKKIFDEIGEYIDYKEFTSEETFKYNHNHNLLPNKNRDKFFSQLQDCKVNEENIIEYLDKYSKRSLITKIKGKLLKFFR